MSTIVRVFTSRGLKVHAKTRFQCQDSEFIQNVFPTTIEFINSGSRLCPIGCD